MNIEEIVGKLTKEESKEMLKQLVYSLSSEDFAEVLKDVLSKDEKAFLIEEWEEE